MRSLTVSVASILLILVIWFGFMAYTKDALTDLTDTLEESIIPSVHAGHWETASEDFYHFSERWHEEKRLFDFFLDNDTMTETDFSIAKAQAYIQARDLGSTLGELSCINEQLRFLYLNEKVTIENLL